MAHPNAAATPAEIANDLSAFANLLERTHYRDAARSMRRGAECIRDLLTAQHDPSVIAQELEDSLREERT